MTADDPDRAGVAERARRIPVRAERRPAERAVVEAPLRIWFTASLLLALALLGCAHMANDTTVCPEYRSLRCATAPECSMDQARGCRVCACSPSRSADREGRMTDPVPPDQRIPDRR